MWCSTPNCGCLNSDPPIGSPDYALSRRHVDAGDVGALVKMTGWLKEGKPFLHIRYADGEFNAIVGYEGANTDGQRYNAEQLGEELHAVLIALLLRQDATLVGGDWSAEPAHKEYLRRHNLFTQLPWCPSQVFVNGIVGLHTLRFLTALQDRSVVLVCNEKVAAIAPVLNAQVVVVPLHDAWESIQSIKEKLFYTVEATGSEVVLYCAGMAAKPLAYWASVAYPSATHIDLGCIFDPAVGIGNRAWCGGVPDERLLLYRSVYQPWLLQQ